MEWGAFATHGALSKLLALRGEGHYIKMPERARPGSRIPSVADALRTARCARSQHFYYENKSIAQEND
jgi:hypothetical protein